MLRLFSTAIYPNITTSSHLIQRPRPRPRPRAAAAAATRHLGRAPRVREQRLGLGEGERGTRDPTRVAQALLASKGRDGRRGADNRLAGAACRAGAAGEVPGDPAAEAAEIGGRNSVLEVN